MRNAIFRIVGATMTALLFVSAASAQNDAIAAAAGDKYVISAKAGGVNFVEGEVSIVRKAGRGGVLLRGDKLEIGDRIATGANGKAEILLNPGSYLRLGGDSAFEFKTTSLDDLQLSLAGGSAIFEVFATEDFKVTVNSPKTNFSLIESGIYRVDVSADGTGKIAVWKGLAQIGNDAATLVKSGREATLAGSQASIAKFDRDDKDALEIWSKARAKELAKISGQLARNTMRTALMRGFLGRSWSVYDSFGLWVYDPFRRSHCFLPFGYGWNSPYGYGFGHGLWYYNLPPVVYQPPANTTVGSQTPRYGPRVPIVKSQTEAPPFIRVQGSSGSTGRDFSAIKPGRDDAGSGSEPIRSSGGATYIPPPSESRANAPTKPRN
ncbi:MAG: FecR domain-containing protein [Pyrinomonadaceae bacterium]